MKVLYRIILLLAASFASLSSCDDNLEVQKAPRIAVNPQQVSSDAGSVFVKVTASGDWTLSMETEGGVSPWGELSESSGREDKSNVILAYGENSSEESRSMRITVTCAGKSADCVFVQNGSKHQVVPTPPAAEITPDPVADWMELPAVPQKEGLYYLTHSQSIEGSDIRSWSFLWDTDALVAHWVAYPLNNWMIGSGSRTDAWGLDPKIPKDLQPVLYKGFKGGYDRGHQLPSADRLNYAANVTSFYGTNMTPQLGGLNQKSWAALEGGVRTWAGAFDTLYVVTGCTVEGSTKVAYDNEGKEVKVPTGYYKALLGFKKSGTVGITGSTGGYTSIAFYFDHENYSGDYMKMAMSVDELEKKLGMDFFVNLPDKIGADYAGKVESSDDSWWKTH